MVYVLCGSARMTAADPIPAIQAYRAEAHLHVD